MALFRDRRGKGKTVNLNDKYTDANGRQQSWSDTSSWNKPIETHGSMLADRNDLMDRVNKALDPQPKRDPSDFTF